MLTIKPESFNIKLEYITHIKNELNFITIFTVYGKNYTSTQHFYLIKEQLRKQGFLQVNHNTLVNTSFIDPNIKLGHKRCLKLFKDTYINISRKRLYELKSILRQGCNAK